MVAKATLPLLMRFMEGKSNRNSLTVADMLTLAEVLEFNENEVKKLKRDELLHTLLDRIGEADTDWVLKIKELMKKPEMPKTLGDTLDEYILSELPLDEQRDFKEIAIEAESKQKTHWSILNQTAEKKPKAKRKAKAKPKPKPKAKIRFNMGRKRKREFGHDSDGPLAPPQPRAPEAPAQAVEDIPTEVAAEVAQASEAPNVEAIAVPPVAPFLEAEALIVAPGLEAPVPPVAPGLQAEALIVAPPLEAEALVAPEVPVAPDAVEAPVEGRAPRGPRAAGRGFVNQWEDVVCPECHKIVGQIKLDPAPGSRDPPTWYMRAADRNGIFPSKGPFFKRKVARLIGEGPEGPTQWVMDNRKCCV